MDKKETFHPYEMNEDENQQIAYEEAPDQYGEPIEHEQQQNVYDQNQNLELNYDYAQLARNEELEEVKEDEQEQNQEYEFQQEQVQPSEEQYSQQQQEYQESYQPSPQKSNLYNQRVDQEDFNPGDVFYESPGRSSKKHSPKKTSKNVMRGIFDQQFSVNQPSQNKIQEIQERLSQSKNQSQNKSYSQQQYQENIDPNAIQNQDSQEQNEVEPQIDFDLIDNCYQQFLDTISQDVRFQGEATVDKQIQIILEFTHNDDESVQIGTFVFLFEILYKNPEVIQSSHKVLILSEIYQQIIQFYEVGNITIIYCILEILSLLGPHKLSFQNLKLIASILLDESVPILQEKAFNVLINLDYPGFQTLLDIANKDFELVSMYILNKLAENREIQTTVIVPSLLNDFTASSNKKKLESLAALNRMYRLVYLGGGLPVLVQLLQEGILDRNLVVSTIRACGVEGEKVLLRVLKKHPNPRVRMAICSVLGWKVDPEQQPTLNVEIVSYQVGQHSNINPGTMCVYQGNLMPCAFIQQGVMGDNSTDEAEDDLVEINSRDFMAALQRLLAVKHKRFQENNTDFMPTQQSQFFNKDDYILVKIIEQSDEQDSKNVLISSKVIKALNKVCLDPKVGVREIALHSLGCIGMPEAQLSIPTIAKCLKDPKSQVRAMAAWCAGEVGPMAAQKTGKLLIKLLKDNYWKVRTASCLALGFMGENLSETVFPVLTKILRDGSINKKTVCQTLIRLGVNGEQILLDILKNVSRSNYKLKASIIDSLKLADVNKPTIDFILEELFRNANDHMVQVRKACLKTLEVLRNRSENNNITYLKPRHILPFFYYFLQDSSQTIRKMAMKSIFAFGPQGELIFIEGLTKDKSVIIRQQCAKGLGLYGPKSFRALLFGLRDINENVQEATSKAIYENFSPEDVIKEFELKPQQQPAIVCAIKEILQSNHWLGKDLKQFLLEILETFQSSLQHNKSRFSQYSDTYKQSQLSQQLQQYQKETDLVKEDQAENLVSRIQGTSVDNDQEY